MGKISHFDEYFSDGLVQPPTSSYHYWANLKNDCGPLWPLPEGCWTFTERFDLGPSNTASQGDEQKGGCIICLAGGGNVFRSSWCFERRWISPPHKMQSWWQMKVWSSWARNVINPSNFAGSFKIQLVYSCIDQPTNHQTLS